MPNSDDLQMLAEFNALDLVGASIIDLTLCPMKKVVISLLHVTRDKKGLFYDLQFNQPKKIQIRAQGSPWLNNISGCHAYEIEAPEDKSNRIFGFRISLSNDFLDIHAERFMISVVGSARHVKS